MVDESRHSNELAPLFLNFKSFLRSYYYLVFARTIRSRTKKSSSFHASNSQSLEFSLGKGIYMIQGGLLFRTRHTMSRRTRRFIRIIGTNRQLSEQTLKSEGISSYSPLLLGSLQFGLVRFGNVRSGRPAQRVDIGRHLFN